MQYTLGDTVYFDPKHHIVFKKGTIVKDDDGDLVVEVETKLRGFIWYPINDTVSLQPYLPEPIVKERSGGKI